MTSRSFFYVSVLTWILSPPAPAQEVPLKYSFGEAGPAGAVMVRPGEAYSDARGYGFDLGSSVVESGDGKAVAGEEQRPFFFSAKVPPGAYSVKVMLGGTKGDSETTVKSETRRLMLQQVRVPGGETKTETFLVHVRVPEIAGGGKVRLKPREKDPILFAQYGEKLVTFKEMDWDDKLTLEFSGKRAAVHGVEIEKAPAHTTVFLIGDSTVTDQMMGPWTGWGQMLPRWFVPPVLVANYAESGETTGSFIGEHRWAKVMTELQPGDYVLMQFGINDQGRIPIEKFKGYFERFIKETREKRGTPVLVTSQNLRKLDAAGHAVETLGAYPEAMREVANAEGVKLIDLNAMSEKLYEALGPEKLPKMFVDGTHQDEYGAYELAKCVVQGMVADGLPLTHFLSPDWKPFDPAKPDSMEAFDLPADPQLDPARPGGPGAPNGQGPMAGAPARKK